MTFLIGVVHKVNENILCRGFLFLLQRKTKTKLQLSDCRYNRSHKCEAVQKSPFWTLNITGHTFPGASYVFIGLPAERINKSETRRRRAVCVCVCVCVCKHACVSLFEQVHCIS